MKKEDTKGRKPANLEAALQKREAKEALNRLGHELEQQLRAHFPTPEQYTAFAAEPVIARTHNGLKLGTISVEDVERFVEAQQGGQEFRLDMPARGTNAKEPSDSKVIALSRKRGLNEESKDAIYESMERWEQGFKLVEEALLSAVPLIDDTPQKSR